MVCVCVCVCVRDIQFCAMCSNCWDSTLYNVCIETLNFESLALSRCDTAQCLTKCQQQQYLVTLYHHNWSELTMCLIDVRNEL